MIIQLSIINPQAKQEPNADFRIWPSRNKTYESDFLDEDIINSPISHKLDRIKIDNTQLSSKKDIDDMILFLKNVKESLEI